MSPLPNVPDVILFTWLIVARGAVSTVSFDKERAKVMFLVFLAGVRMTGEERFVVLL